MLADVDEHPPEACPAEATAEPTAAALDLAVLARFTETGDPEAFAEVSRRYAGMVYAASYRILQDAGRAQDVSQETFYRLMRQPRLVSHSLAGWLHRTATHLALDEKRSDLARKRREKAYFLARHADEAIVATEPRWNEVSPFVDEALNEVPEPNRTLLVRHFLQGTPQAELAAELNTSPATVSRRIKTGVELLQKQLQQRGIYLGLATLAAFCAARGTEAAVPAGPAFLAELGKMKLLGYVRLAPPGAANPPPAKAPVGQMKVRDKGSASPVGPLAAGIIVAAVSLAAAASAFLGGNAGRGDGDRGDGPQRVAHYDPYTRAGHR